MAELTAAPPSDCVTRSPRFFLAIFCLIASVNYSDRGALNAVLTNAQAAMCLNAAQAGWLPSAFVVGYIAAAPVFAHLASTPVFEGKSFRLIALGLCCFSIGSVLTQFCAVMGPSGYVPFLLSRAVVGIGEASFFVVAPPMLDRVAPIDQRAVYLALFYATIPVGMAIGYGIGGVLGAAGRWDAIFSLDAVLMLPFIVLCFCAPSSWGDPPPRTDDAAAAHSMRKSEQDPRALERRSSIVVTTTDEPPWGLPLRLLRQPVYLCLCLGYAAYSATIGGMAIYAPQFLQYVYNLQQDSAAMSFSVIMSVTGLVGSALGGFLLERIKAGETATASEAAKLGAVLMLAALPLCELAFFLPTGDVLPFYGVVSAAMLLLFMKEGPINSAMMWCVSDELKPHAMAFSMLLCHLLGDIPSPPILGAMLDATADFAECFVCMPGALPDEHRVACVELEDGRSADGDELSHCSASPSAAECGPHAEFDLVSSCGGEAHCRDSACVCPDKPDFNNHGDLLH